MVFSAIAKLKDNYVTYPDSIDSLFTRSTAQVWTFMSVAVTVPHFCFAFRLVSARYLPQS